MVEEVVEPPSQYAVGDLVWSPFPHTNLRSITIRPITLLRYVGMDDWIACMITTNLYADRPRVISVEDGDLSVGALPLVSVVRYDRLHTINQEEFDTYIGRLTDEKLAEITAAVRALF